MSAKQTYYVTEKAGHFVAGRRSPGKDQSIALFPVEAEHDLILGTLSKTPPTTTPPAEPDQPTAPARKGKASSED